MKFWQSLAFVEMDQMTELARFCEELGFHGVSYGDHLVTTAEQVDDYEYGDNGNILWNPDTHWPDPWVHDGSTGRGNHNAALSLHNLYFTTARPSQCRQGGLYRCLPVGQQGHTGCGRRLAES